MSKLDTFIEQVAFGLATPQPSRSLGLYLSPEVIYLSETHLEKDNKLIVDHLVRIPVPEEAKKTGTTATMNTDFMTDPLKMAGLIQQSMSQLRWNSKNVRVTLSHHLGLLRYFTMPDMERRFLRGAVPLEAKKYIPIPFEVLAHDHQARPLPPDPSGKSRIGVMIAVTQKKNIINVQGLINSLGLKLTGIEVSPCSVLRLWENIDASASPTPYIHVHMDGGSVRVVVVDNGVPVFFREVFLGQETTISDLRRIDLPGCLSFVQKQLGMNNISRLRVSGNIPNLNAMLDALAGEVALPATVQDTPKLLSIKSGDWGGYASLGASAHSLVPTKPAINLVSDDRVTDEERQVARDILFAGAAMGLFFSLSGIAKSLTYQYRVQELHQYESKIDSDLMATLGGLDPAGTEALMRDMQIQLDMLRGVTASARRIKISALLKEIVDAMPEHLWLESFHINNPLQATDRQTLSILMHGHVQDQSVVDEQNLAFAFKDALIKNPKLGKSFEIGISVQKISTDEGNPLGLDPRALAAKLEGRTQFTLELKAK
jgi:Tfp pilus assembly PilM family ATPase